MTNKKMSKTKLGAILIGVGAIMGTVGGMLTKAIPLDVGIQTLLVEVGVVITALGVRDLPILNLKK